MLLNKIIKVAKDIKSIKIQWATNIAKSAFNILKEEISIQKFKDKSDFFQFFNKSINLLQSARPTEPLLFNWMKYIFAEVQKNKNQNLNILQPKTLKVIDDFINLLHKANESSLKNSKNIIKNWDSILTHCHSSSVMKIFQQAKKKWLKFQVYNTETRPLFQWRLTSKDLLSFWIPTTMIVDLEASFLISHESWKHLKIDKIIIWCDAIGMSWRFINKVWSFGIAMAAHYCKVPLYVSCNLLKVDVSDHIPVEKRWFKEIWKDAPNKLKILNFAFDLIPAEFVTGWYITEFGIIKPKDIKKIVQKKYPRMK